MDRSLGSIHTHDQDMLGAEPGRVGVLLPLPFPGPFDYCVPEGMIVVPGDYVEVPLGPRRVIGVVWGPAAGDVAAKKLKAILRICDLPPYPEHLRRLIDWIADYTLTPPGMVLRLGLRVPQALERPAPIPFIEMGTAHPDRLTPNRLRVLEVLGTGLAQPPKALAELANVSAAVLKSMLEAGLIQRADRIIEPSYPLPDSNHLRAALSDDQRKAADDLTDQMARGFSVSLLQGVTGSGKTEVYFEAIAACLRLGRQVLILLPEIALSVQFLARFEARFGVKPAQWHSEVAPPERKRVWRAAALGRAPIIVGARSALFLPLPNLGLIVVDEEHDGAFKQEDGVIYHARDMAVVRAQLGDIPIILASATPSLESQVNVDRGRYRLVALTKRHGAAEMPAISAIDMRRERLGGGRFLSTPLVQAMTETLARGEQSLLFLNRRGYAPLTLCRACGHRLSCPECSAWLIEHRFEQRLVCHHCGYAKPIPPDCPQCHAMGTMIPCGPGVERLIEEAADLFPEARRAVLSSDQTSSPREVRAVINAFGAGEIDILIGTQIVAKGHHFPRLTLVGVVDADLGLHGADPRAGERTFQLLNQVAGRAGRAERPGRVLVQTFDPDNPVMRALVAGNATAFYQVQKAERQAEAMPPFGRLAALVLSGPDLTQVAQAAQDLARAAPQGPDIQVLGPAPAALARLRGLHRLRLLLKAGRGINLADTVRAWISRAPPGPQIRLTIDVDPQSFL
jgi:primosomal protein N' (replication factor Y)